MRLCRQDGVLGKYAVALRVAGDGQSSCLGSVGPAGRHRRAERRRGRGLSCPTPLRHQVQGSCTRTVNVAGSTLKSSSKLWMLLKRLSEGEGKENSVSCVSKNVPYSQIFLLYAMGLLSV